MRALTLTLCLGIASMAMACSSTPDPKPDEGLTKTTPRDLGKASDAEINAAMKSADMLLAKGDYKEAVTAYDKVIQLAPKRWELYHNRAIAQSFIPDFDAAIESINQALTLGAEQDPRAWFTLGNIYQNRNMYEESIDAYRASLSLHNKPHVETLLNISAGYIFLRRYDEARKTLDYILSFNPNEHRALHNLALIPHLNQDYKTADMAYSRIHEVAPNYAYSYFNHADALKDWKKCDQAIPLYQKYLQLEPDGPYIIKAKARLQLCQEQTR